jgi:hypothetical protein
MERIYFSILEKGRRVSLRLVPILRRLIRFLALPVYFFSGIDWDVCPRSRIKVAFDLLYIFFRLKYYPDNYSLCHLWEKDRSQWHLYYGSIYNPYARFRLRREVQPKDYLIVFDDKHVCYQICKANGLPLPEQPAFIQPNEDVAGIISGILRSNPSRELVVKPVLGQGGLGIVLARMEKDQVVCIRGEEKFPLDQLVLTTPAVVQFRILQHPTLQAVSSSTNTVRLVTLLTRDDDVILLGGISKFGRQGAFLDNRSRGGVGAGLDMETGRLMKYALDFRSRKHLKHPESGVTFEGFQLPDWDKALELAKRTQRLFPNFRLLGLDLAFSVDGPVLLEINPSHDNVGLEQACGPILARERVWEEFKRYDLLFSRAQLRGPPR